MKAYKIKDNRIIAIRILTGELQADEIQGDFKIPIWDGVKLIETWTQAIEDAEILQAKLILRDRLKAFRVEAAAIISVYREFNSSASNEFLTARTAFINKYNIVKDEILALNELEEINNYVVNLEGEIESLGSLI